MEGKEHWRNRLRVRIRRFESAQVRDALVLDVGIAAVQGDEDQRESLLVEQARVLGEAMFYCAFGKLLDQCVGVGADCAHGREDERYADAIRLGLVGELPVFGDFGVFAVHDALLDRLGELLGVMDDRDVDHVVDACDIVDSEVDVVSALVVQRVDAGLEDVGDTGARGDVGDCLGDGMVASGDRAGTSLDTKVRVVGVVALVRTADTVHVVVGVAVFDVEDAADNISVGRVRDVEVVVASR